jgi:hypothetical protein
VLQVQVQVNTGLQAVVVVEYTYQDQWHLAVLAVEVAQVDQDYYQMVKVMMA